MSHPIQSALVNGQPFIMSAAFTSKCSSFCVASHISRVNINSGMFLQVSTALLLRFILEFSSSLFS